MRHVPGLAVAAAERAADRSVAAASDRYLRAFLDVSIVCLLIFAAIWAATMPDVPAPYASAAFLLLVYLPARLLMAWGRTRPARLWFVYGNVLVVFVAPWLVNGVRSPILAEFPVMLFVTGWLLGRRSMLALAAAFAGLVLALWLAETQGLFKLPLPLRPANAWMANYVALDILTAAMLWIVFTHYKAASGIETGLRVRLAREVGRTEAAHRQLADVLNALSAQICVLDAGGRIVAVNRSWREAHAASDAAEPRAGEGLHYLAANPAAARARASASGEAPDFATLLDQVLAGRCDGFEAEYASHTRDARRWFYARVSRIAGSTPLRVVVTHEDVSALRQVQNDLSEALGFRRKLIAAMQDGVCVVDNDQVVFEVNPALCRMTGFERDELLGRSPPLPWWPPEEQERLDSAFQATARTGGGDFELVFMRRDGERFPVDVAVAKVLDEAGLVIGYVSSVKDITEHKRLEADIQRLAFHDPLTNLPNRRLFEDRLGRAVAANRRSGRHGAVLVLDLDNFKPLNDEHGHAAGDLLLMQVADRLQACVREADTVARMGGDEFVVIVSELDAGRASSTAHARLIAEKIRAALAEPYSLAVPQAGHTQLVEHRCSASVGVFVFGPGAADEAAILKRADAAMYQAKGCGRNRISVYADADEPGLASRG